MFPPHPFCPPLLSDNPPASAEPMLSLGTKTETMKRKLITNRVLTAAMNLKPTNHILTATKLIPRYNFLVHKPVGRTRRKEE